MQRVAWTDERLDDLSRRMDTGFDRVDRDIRDLRGDMNTGFAGLREEMNSGDANLRGEMNVGFADLRHEIDRLRLLMYRFGIGLFGTLVATVLLRGI